MIELGKKNEIFGVGLLRRIEITGRPARLPLLETDQKVTAGYDQGLGERMIVCDTLEDMQQIYDSYAQGWALSLNWYIGPDPGFVAVLGPNGEPEQSD